MLGLIKILNDSVVLYQNWIHESEWEHIYSFPHGGLTFKIANDNIKFFATHDYFYRNLICSFDLPVHIIDELNSIDGDYSDEEEIAEILNRIYPLEQTSGVDLRLYLKKSEAEELYYDKDEIDDKLDDYYDKQEIDEMLDDLSGVTSGDVINIVSSMTYTKEEIDDKLDDKADKDDVYTKAEADAKYQPKGDYVSATTLDNYYTKAQSDAKYLTEHQPIKTINHQSLIGTGNIDISGGSITVDSALSTTSTNPVQNKVITNALRTISGNTYTKTEADAKFISQIKTINNQSLIGTGNIDIGSGGTIDVDDTLSSSSTNPVQNRVITNALNGKLNTTAYTAPVQSDWNATSGLAAINNKPTIPSKTSDLNNDAGFITSASPVFNNYYTTCNTYNKTQIDDLITHLQSQITELIDDYSECCTAMTLSGTAIIHTTSSSQIVDVGSANQIQVFSSSKKTVYPAATLDSDWSLGVAGDVPCTFKLTEGITYLSGWKNAFSVKYQFNGGFTKIADLCFEQSTRLKTLDFHDKLDEIRDRAFWNCTALESLIFRSTTPPTLAGSINALDDLYSVNTNFKIYVPAASVNTYKTASGWSTHASRIYPIS